MSKQHFAYDVFLCHNSADHASIDYIAQCLQERAGLHPFLDKWHLVPGEPWQDAVEQALARSVAIAVFMGPSGIGPWQHEEMRVALDSSARQGKRIIPVLLPSSNPDSMPDFLRQRHWIDWRAGVEDEVALGQLVTGVRGEGVMGFVSPVLRSPPPPSTFTGRSEQIDYFSKLFEGYSESSISTAIVGMAGIGKSTLARKLGQVLAPNFPGGVLWIPTGQNADKTVLIDRLRMALNLDRTDLVNPDENVTEVRAHLELRGRMFVILDDLWDVDLGQWVFDVLLPFDRVLLVTSRDITICRSLCHHVQRLDPMPATEGTTLVENIVGPLGSHTVDATQICELLGGVPLAIEVAVRLCDNGAYDLPWLLRQLHSRPILDILKLVGGDTPYRSVEASIALSYRSLDKDLRRRFRALGVFADADYDIMALAAVWSDDRIEIAEEAARGLSRRALLVESPNSTGTTRIFRQHILIRQFALKALSKTHAGRLTVENAKRPRPEIWWVWILKAAFRGKTPASRHACYYVDMALRDWRYGVRFWDQIRHAWKWTALTGPTQSLRFYSQLREFLNLRGENGTQIEWITDILGLAHEWQYDGKTKAWLLHNIGVCYIAVGDWQNGEEYLKRALQLSSKNRDLASVAATLSAFGGLYAEMGEIDKALMYFQQSYDQMVLSGDAENLGTIVNAMAMAYFESGDLTKSRALLEYSLTLHQQSGNKEGEAVTCNNLALIFEQQGDMVMSEQLQEQSIAISREIGARRAELWASSNAAIRSAEVFGNASLDELQRFLTEARQMQDRTGEFNALFNLGAYYHKINDTDGGVAVLRDALASARNRGWSKRQGMTLIKLAEVHRDHGDYEIAVDYLQQAIDLQRRSKDSDGEALSHNEIGVIYALQGKFQEAIVHSRRSLALVSSSTSEMDKAAILHNAGKFCVAMDNMNEALKYFLEAKALMWHATDSSMKGEVFHYVGALYSSIGEPKLALENLTEARLIHRRAGNVSGELDVLTNLAGVYETSESWSEMLTTYHDALLLQREVNIPADELPLLFKVGKASAKLGKIDTALKYFGEALEITSRLDDKNTALLIRRGAGLVFKGNDMPELAHEYFTGALRNARQLGELEVETELVSLIETVSPELDESLLAR